MRETYLEPHGISVTDAAKLIGISRPGVSNFLNGKVSVTENIAVRIERAFGMPKADLLRRQAEYDATMASQASAPADTKTYVPPFLGIRANEIEAWADHNIPARIRFAVLLRTLVHSTGVGLQGVEFHGNDDAERPGWDGQVVASAGTPWIPEGTSGWEFGVNADVKAKADGDFEKSVKAHKDAKERAQITFVFVTPRRWAGKDAWAVAMRANKLWKDVRAYDASDLEQWLEQSPAAQAWFANETNRPSQGVRSLDQCWSEWVDVANPPISPTLFDTATGIGRPKLKSFLDKPAGSPFVIAADSVEEALAFLAQAFSDPEQQASRDKVLVFDRPGTLPKLAQGMQDFIAVVYTREVERELALHVHKLRAIIVYPRNATNEDPNLTLEPLGYESFRKGLEAMGLPRDEISRLANESGHSLTVLRRRLSKVEAVRTPKWASEHDAAARALLPMALIGAWNAQGEADQVAVCLLAGKNIEYNDIEKSFQELLRLNDAPVWSIGNHRGVVSKLDALFAIAHAITLNDLNCFLEIAKLILSEDDPALDVPEKDRWWAGTNGKRREFSGALRSGVAETLVLLAIHGKHLFFKRLGFDGEAAVACLVRGLLLPLTTRKLEANERDLPVYAEAAPDTFLKILEEDLRSPEAQVLGLMRPVDTSLFGVSSPRTGLLWALEGLAWSPDTFMRAVLILARLSQVELNDNLGNKPIASLEAIFRAWMPQTAADHDARVKAIATLLEKYPEVGWVICVDQFGYGNDVGGYSHKPCWRADGYGFGEPFLYMEPVHKFRVAMVGMALERPAYTVKMIGDLVERLHGLGSEYQGAVWAIVDAWRKGGASDDDVAVLRDKIRRTVLSRRGLRRSSETGLAALTEAARKIYDSLEPTDLINKHEWLFRQSWVEESADDIEDERLDFNKREERIARLREEALRAIYDARGIEGVYALAAKGSAQGQIGWIAVRSVLPKDQIEAFIDKVLQPGANELTPGHRNLVSGSMQALTEEDCVTFLRKARARLAEDDFVRLLLLSPYRKSAWAAADEMSQAGQEAFWREVHPSWVFEPEEHNNESVERLLKAMRPRAAFSAVHFRLKALRPSLLVEILSAIAQGGKDRDGEYQLEEYHIKEAFALLDRNPDVTLEKKAGLEFAYIKILAQVFGRGERHIVNLERYVEANPEMWVQALAWAYKRKSGGEDPVAFKLPEGRKDLAERGWRLLEGIQRIPGEQSDGTIHKDKLSAWIEAVRKASAELDRADVCDVCVGQMLSHAPVGADGVWPCEPVRDVMEGIESPSLFRGAHTGLYNSRGVVVGEGGNKERELARKYRGWGESLRFTHPHLSASLLMGMAKTYEQQAEREDEEVCIRRRLRH